MKYPDSPSLVSPERTETTRDGGYRSARRPVYETPRITFRQAIDQVAAVCPPPNGKASALVCIIGSS